MFDSPGEPSAPGEAAVDGESCTVAEVEHVEIMSLRSIFVERRAGQRGLEVAEDHGPLTDGEDTELREALAAERYTVASSEQAPVTNATQVAVQPETAGLIGGEP